MTVNPTVQNKEKIYKSQYGIDFLLNATISASVSLRYLYFVFTERHRPLRSMICGGIPTAKASVVPPALGECRPYNLASRPPQFNIVLKAWRAAEYEILRSGTTVYSDLNVSQDNGGNKNTWGEGVLVSSSK